MPRPPIPVRLKAEDLTEVRSLLRGGVQQVRVVLRALALKQLAAGVAPLSVAKSVPLTAKAIRELAHRYNSGGLERALYDKQRPGASQILNASQKQRIVAMVCSQPPQGRARWTVRLVAREAVRRRLVPRVGRETVRVLLESHDLKPWREKNVVRGKAEPPVHPLDGGRAGSVREAL